MRVLKALNIKVNGFELVLKKVTGTNYMTINYSQLLKKAMFAFPMEGIKLLLVMCLVMYTTLAFAQPDLIKGYQMLSNSKGNLTGLGNKGQFGYSVYGAGDFDNDGVNDILVGAPLDGYGAVWVLMLNRKAL